MTTTTLRPHLRLVHSRGPREESRPVMLRHRPAPARFAAVSRDPLCGVATRQALFERLESLGDLAPAAPLSFVTIKVLGLAHLNREVGEDCGDRVLQSVATEIASITRATDMVGRLSGTVFGVVLQGTGAIGADTVAARLGNHLAHALSGVPYVQFAVGAATGTGVNFEALPLAACESFEDLPEGA